MISLVQAYDTRSANSTEVCADRASAVCAAALSESVSAVPRDPIAQSFEACDESPSADEIHEDRIAHCKAQMERSYALYQSTGSSHHHGVATYWRIEFERAIAKRSPEQAAKLKGQA